MDAVKIKNKKIQPFEENENKIQMTVGNASFTPYQSVPFVIWIKEKAMNLENQ